MAKRDNEKGQLLLGGDDDLELTPDDLTQMFHPDNIKNFTLDGVPVAISLHQYWQLIGGAQGIARALKTNLKTGIEGSAQDIRERIDRFGSNTKRIPKIRSLWDLILEALGDNTLIMLIVLATVNVIIGIYQEGWSHGWIDGVAIYGAVVIIVGIAAGNNYSKEKQFQKLVAKASIEYCAVFRGTEGMTQTIAVSELVVGDVIKIEQGMRIPADCLLLDGIDVTTDESAMTGEPDQMEKSHVTQANYEHNPDPFLLGKTLVQQGQGTALVCCVGTNSRSGMAEEKLQTEEDQTPLQQKLESIANSLAKFGALFAVIAFLLGCGRIVLTNLLAEGDASVIWELGRTLDAFLKAFITGVTVVVIAVPEGLPLAVTISFAFSVMKMKMENNLVRKLQSSETMGGANEVCTDKTGTLTKNQMTVKEFYTMDTVFQGRPSNFRELATAELMGEGVLYNCSARIERNDRGEQEPKGNVTEQGLIRCLMDLQVPCMDTLLAKDQYMLHLIPFNSSRKRAATCIRHPKNPNLVRAFCKGAPEIVLTYVTKMFDKNGKVVPIDEAQKEHIKRKIVGDTFAVKAYRTLLIAYADYSYDEYLRLKDANNGFAGESDREALEQGLTLIGIFALQDPLRDEVIPSVRICHRAGINIRMVTGDNIDTAKAIALEAGILKHEHKDRKYAVMDGKTFREACGGLRKIDTGNDLLREEIVNKEIFKEIAANLQVLGRSTPEDKYMLVTGLRDLGATVAVTGDGTNDAPALKRADVGFAMGISGTEVAKEAADIILLDDNFASIVTAVKWGRNIFSCVRKFLQFQLVINIGAIIILIVGSVVLAADSQPMGTLQMLWINILMDTFAALALATEPPSMALLDMKPYSRKDSIITPVMWRNIIGQVIYQIIIFMLLLFLVPPGIIPYNFLHENDGFITKKYYDIDDDLSPPAINPIFYGRCITGTESAPVVGGPGTRWQACNYGNGYMQDVRPSFDDNPAKGRHYAFLFNTYVMLQIFNEVNARKLLPNEINPFAGFFNNKFFLIILVISVVVQIALVEVEVFASVLKIRPLNMIENLVSVGIGASCIIWGFFIKIFPLSWFGAIKINEEALSDEAESKSLVSTLRKSHRQSVRQSVRKTEEFNKRESMRQLSVRKSRGMSGALSMRASAKQDRPGAAANKHGSRAINE